MRGSTLSKLVVFLLVLLLATAQPVAAHPIEPQDGYAFVSEAGNTTVASVDLLSWWEGDTLVLELHLFPTQDEIDALLNAKDGFQHVDFEFTLYGLDVTGQEPSVEVWKSDFTKYIDEDVVPGYAGPIVRAQGFNLNKWVAGEDHTIRLSIQGFVTDGTTIPQVEVAMVSTSWYPVEAGCTAEPDRYSVDDVPLCRKTAGSSRLVDLDGDYRLFD